MKHFGIILAFLLILCSCSDSTKNHSCEPKSYTVKYEVMYPNGTKQFTIKTKKGRARVRKWHTGFFHGGPMVYSLQDEGFKEYTYEEFPIIIISQQ